MQHIQATRRRVGIQPPLGPRIRVQVIKADRQARMACITGVMPDLKIADRAVGVVKHTGFEAVFHTVKLGAQGAKSNSCAVTSQRPQFIASPR